MSLSLACPNCGKKYRAPDHLAGHKVKCRGCGTAFALGEPADEQVEIAPAATQTSHANRSAASTFAGKPPAGASPKTRAVSAVAAGAADSSGGATETLDTADAVFQSAFSSSGPALPGTRARRANVPIPYPGSRQLDHWIPIVLPIISLLWVGIEVFVSNDSGAGWVPIIRLLTLLLGFFLIILPIGWLSVNVAAAQGRFYLPPSPKLRTIAAFAFPTAVAAFLYLSLGSLSSAIPGAVMGVAIAMGAAWLLLRVRPNESAVTLIATGSGFAIAMMICAGLLLAMNSGVHNLAGKSAAQLAASPLGPGLPWRTTDKDTPKKKKPEQPAATPNQGAPAPAAPVAATQQIASAATTDDPFGPSTEPPTAAPAEPVKPAVPAAPVVVAPLTTPTERQPSPKKEDNAFQGLIFGPATKKPPKVMPEEEDPDPAALPAAPASTPPPGPAAVPTDYTDAGGDPIAFSILAGKSPLVGKVRKTEAIGQFERIVPTLYPSSVAMVVKRGDQADQDLLEVWDIVALKKLRSVSVKRDVAEGISAPGDIPTYATNGLGAIWIRITSFPKLSLEVTPFSGNSPPIRMPLVGPGEYSVLGFIQPSDLMVVRCRDGDVVRLDLWDIKSQKRVKQMNLPFHATDSANAVISPDGKFVAVASMAGGGASAKTVLYVINLAGGERPLSHEITSIGPQRGIHPAGMAFSRDGKRLGILYEQGGSTSLLTYQLPTLTPLPAMAAPAGHIAPAAHESVGGRLTSVADGRAWLVGGNVVIDAETGNIWGELGVEQVPCAQLAFPSMSGEVGFIAGDAGQRRLTLVGLKPPALPATRPK